MEPLNPDEYTVGWICAIKNEVTSAKAMLDAVHEPLLQQRNDSNVYILGRIGKHNVVIASLPAGKLGTHSAAITATHMFRTFTQLRFCLMVGVAGGIPSDMAEVKLGDVVVSTPRPKQNAVVQYDFGKAGTDGFVRTHSRNDPPRVLLNAINSVQSEHSSGNYGYLHYMSSVPESIRIALKVPGPRTSEQNPHIFYGTIASGNQLIANAAIRDSLKEEIEALAIEMESGGLMDDFGCLSIRGICDYSDSTKNKEWQGAAALAAAAYAKELLSFIQPEAPIRITSTTTASTSTAAAQLSAAQGVATQLDVSAIAPSPAPSASLFVVNREILESWNSVALGRLVTNLHEPWVNYCADTPLPDKNHVGLSIEPRVHEIVEATRGMPVHERFLRMLSRVLEDEDVFGAINSVFCREKTYVLCNPALRFKEMCRRQEVRKWLNDPVLYAGEIYMVVGIHTLSTPSTRRSAVVDSVATCSGIASGEVIVAILYGKVSYEWHWLRKVDGAFLQLPNVWEPAFSIKGGDKRQYEREIVVVTLQETVTVEDYTDKEREILTVNGQVIVL